MEYLNERILLPGQIENWVTIMNVGKLGVNAIDKKTLKSLIGNLSDYYRCRNRRTFVLNTTFAIKILWNIIKPFLHAHT